MEDPVSNAVPPPAAVKPALKKSSGLVAEDGNDNNPSSLPGGDKTASKHSKKKTIHIEWDEAKIKEHDLLRGTRQKIDEPDTPYHHNYDSGSEASGGSHRSHERNDKDPKMDWNHLQNKLDAAAAAADKLGSPGGGDNNSQTSADDDDDDDDDPEQRKKELKALEFQEHRKRHYNEMELVRKFRMEHPDDDEDDEDADDAEE